MIFTSYNALRYVHHGTLYIHLLQEISQYGPFCMVYLNNKTFPPSPKLHNALFAYECALQASYSNFQVEFFPIALPVKPSAIHVVFFPRAFQAQYPADFHGWSPSANVEAQRKDRRCILAARGLPDVSALAAIRALQCKLRAKPTQLCSRQPQPLDVRGFQ